MPQFQTRTATSEQAAVSRLRHYRWPHEVERPRSWFPAIIVLGVLGALVLYGCM